jgi:fructose-specific phosphotransferase system component IIB
VIIFANDVGVRERDRFADHKVLQSTPKAAIKDAKGLIEQAEALVAE